MTESILYMIAISTAGVYSDSRLRAAAYGCSCRYVSPELRNGKRCMFFPEQSLLAVYII